MQDFLANYGLWLLIALIIIAAIFFLLKGKARRDDATVAPQAEATLAENIPPPSLAPEQAIQPGPAVEEPVIAPASGAPDNLLQLKGVGPKVNAMLNGLGVTRFDQIAAWTDADIAAMDKRLGNFSGRITRDHWVDQAGYLAKGDIAGFEAKYGKL